MYDLHAPRWRMEQDFSEMTADVLATGAYLPRFSSEESANDYTYRRSMSAPLDLCRDAVRIRIDNMWRTPPKREVDKASRYADLLWTLIYDADDDGTPLDAFMRRLAWQHYVTGADVVTQMTRAADGREIKTQADARDANIRPYFLQFGPLARYDWAVRGNSTFKWARYFLGRKPPSDEKDGSDPVDEYLTVSDSGWRLYTVTHPGGGNAEQIVETEGRSNEAALGMAPVLKGYFAESMKDGQGGVPVSLLSRPAIIAKVLLNLKSQADVAILANVPRWFISGAGENAPDTYGPQMLIKLMDPAAKIGVVQGDSAHIAEIREWINLYVGEMLRLFKFRGGMAEINANSGSGLKLAIERTDLDNELRERAAFLEGLELEMMRHAVVMATGVAIRPENAAEELGYSVSYNRDFVLEPVGEIIDNLGKWVNAGFVSADVPSLTREMLYQLRNALVRDDSSAAVEIDAEIEGAELTGVADPGEPELEGNLPPGAERE